MTTQEHALVDPPLYRMQEDHANDNEPDEGAIDDPDQFLLFPQSSTEETYL
jgi:hypothetical protein